MTLKRSQMLLGAAAFAAAPGPAKAQTRERVRLAGVTTDDLTPVFYGIKSGLYQKAGLDLEVVPTSSGTVAMMSAWVDKNGGDSRTMWVEVPNVCILQEPAVTAAMDTGKVRSIAPGYRCPTPRRFRSPFSRASRGPYNG